MLEIPLHPPPHPHPLPHPLVKIIFTQLLHLAESSSSPMMLSQTFTVKLVTELVTYLPSAVEAQSDQWYYGEALAADIRTFAIAFDNPLNKSDTFVCSKS